jgi:phospholipase C
VQYVSQLPILERRIPTSFFQDGFEFNWNQQQYVSAAVEGKYVYIDFKDDLAALHGLKDMEINTGVPLVEARNIRTTSTRFNVGAGPLPWPTGGNAVFFSLRIDLAADGKIEIPLLPDVELPAIYFTFRFYLHASGSIHPKSDYLEYLPSVESNLLDMLAGVEIPDPELTNPFHTVNAKAKAKKAIEDALYHVQRGDRSISKFGDFLKPWLIGGRNEIVSISYAPGPADTLGSNGIVEPATGEMIVRYIGTREKPSTEPKLHLAEAGDASPAPVDDGAIKLFDLPDEDPDPVPGEPTGVFGGFEPFVPRPNIGPLAKIDHIVVLMQENRSFDQVLGYLRRDKINPDVDGLLPSDDPNSENQFNRFEGRNFFPRKADRNDPPRADPNAKATAWPSFAVPGPGHDTDDVLSQIDNNMGRFVANFAKRVGSDSPHLRLVMDYFGPDDLPVYAELAKEFGICDNWYTSHAGPTWPNRFVFISGDLNLDELGNVEENNPDVKTMIPIQAPTIFDHLTANGATWRVYEHGYSFIRLYRNFTFDTTNILPFDDSVHGFEAAARSGALPQVTVIEPDYIDLPPGNDDHPPADMAGGQNLISRIVRALIESPAWERTLFIITYDEHGGFYDHKQPPTDAPPLRGSRRTMGPRVPAFVISPMVKPGSVFHGLYDHTSIGATILRRFAEPRPPKVSPRLDAARDLRDVLELAETPRPRSDFIVLLGRLPPATKLRSTERSALKASRKRIDVPDDHSQREDFHWALSMFRLVTGEPPKITKLVKPVVESGEGANLCNAERAAMKEAQARVDEAKGRIKELQAQLRGRHSSDEPRLSKRQVMAEIALIRKEELPQVMAPLKAARRAYNACMNRRPSITIDVGKETGGLLGHATSTAGISRTTPSTASTGTVTSARSTESSATRRPRSAESGSTSMDLSTEGAVRRRRRFSADD